MARRPNKTKPGYVCLGAFAGAHGIRGEVKVKTFTGDPFAIGDYGPVETDDGRVLKVKPLRAAKDVILARVEGVGDRTAAEGLKGQAFYVARKVLPEAEDDEFYYADLIGLDVVQEGGEVLGTVKSVQDFGAGDLLEVRLAETGKTVLLPFTTQVVPRVDLAAGRIEVVPPEGLLDETPPEKEGET